MDRLSLTNAVAQWWTFLPPILEIVSSYVFWQIFSWFLLVAKNSPGKRLFKCVFLPHFKNADEGRKLIINANGLERLYKFVLAAPDDKSYDAVVHKIGQTILRCVPLQDLPGHTNWHSAFVYHPFVPVGDGANSDVSGPFPHLRCRTELLS